MILENFTKISLNLFGQVDFYFKTTKKRPQFYKCGNKGNLRGFPERSSERNHIKGENSLERKLIEDKPLVSKAQC